MPRDGSGVYSLPFPDVVTNTTIASTVYNGFEHDIATDLNAPRPIVAGGTGGTSIATAMVALKGEQYDQVVTNYDSHVFLPGTFYSASTATAEPVDGHAFVGMCAWVDANNMFLEAFDRDDTSQPGARWTRQKKAGVWSSWAKDVSLNVVGTPAANQFTTWQSSTALQGVAITGLVKGNGASAPSAAAAGTDYVGPPATPTALVGTAAIAGSANTGMRSDAAPAINQAMTPTWSALHTFTTSPVVPTPAAGDNSTKAASTAFVAALANPRGYLTGLTLSMTGSSTTFSIASGAAGDSTGSVLMTLAAFTKTSGAWAVGSGNGALDTGSISNNTWYHVYLIRRPDTGVVDVLVSLSATTPTLPTNYTQSRRIGAMRTTASLGQWIKFIQLGDEFLWDVPVVDVAMGTAWSTATNLQSVTVPTNVQVNALLLVRSDFVTNSGALLVSSPDVTDTAPTGAISTNVVNSSATQSLNSISVRTDTSGRVRTRANATGPTFSIATQGWIDRRGRDA